MTAAAGRGSIVEGEFVFTAEDFRHIAQMLHAHAGIALNEGKAALVYSRLAKRLRVLGLRSFRDYCALVEGVDGVDERQKMTAALTTNVTRFYREPHHFDDLRDRVMPELAARARAGGRVRLWSAACSNGQEPYSMALTVLQALPEAAEQETWGHPTFRVRGKMFGSMAADGTTASFKADRAEQAKVYRTPEQPDHAVGGSDGTADGQ